ncbi:SET domain-containing protein [Aulographum hederae CBS 113979]|uniref:SET domain-containing protein n=1 Tax=Aulographum hederae CBS 113979 TaxID=1176131 RepID=A0A6G1GJY3_9PEZI|nr:SET domain-containing protein [Aulographum hederae CBS 113979]
MEIQGGARKVDATLIPTPAMESTAMRSATKDARKHIRAEFARRLREFPGACVALVNTRDHQTPPLNFRFIEKCVLGEGVYQAGDNTILGCTQCRPHMGQGIGCEYTQKCDCLEYAAVDERRLNEQQREMFERGETASLPKRFPYFGPTSATPGCLVKSYLDSRNCIYECNQRCPCGPICKSRVVQKGRQVELEIFKTVERGWGLRCNKIIRKGQFIDTYRGEIITNEEAEKREESSGASKESYLYNLDKFPEIEDPYVIDGEFMGGVTRFINHSCDPNCRQYTVSYNKNDARIYDLAFFAVRDIAAKEELTFDYLDKDEEEAGNDVVINGSQRQDGDDMFLCRCGAKNCRRTLWK